MRARSALSARTFPCEPLSDALARLRSAVGIAAAQGPDDAHRRRTDPLLLRLVIGRAGSCLEPLARDAIEQAGDAHPLLARGVLQVRLESWREPPALDLALHGLQHTV